MNRQVKLGFEFGRIITEISLEYYKEGCSDKQIWEKLSSYTSIAFTEFLVYAGRVERGELTMEDLERLIGRSGAENSQEKGDPEVIS